MPKSSACPSLEASAIAARAFTVSVCRRGKAERSDYYPVHRKPEASSNMAMTSTPVQSTPGKLPYVRTDRATMRAVSECPIAIKRLTSTRFSVAFGVCQRPSLQSGSARLTDRRDEERRGGKERR